MNFYFKDLFNWILTVRKNYRDVYYHNWIHGFNSFQSMFAVFENTEIRNYFDDLQKLGLFIACLSHDLDHRGTNNKFQEKYLKNILKIFKISFKKLCNFNLKV